MNRGVKFLFVGALGFIVQLTALELLTSLVHLNWLTATAAAIQCAVLHNFCWHARWTWREPPGRWLVRLVKFHAAAGLTSIAGNVVVMAVLIVRFSIPVLPANGAAVLIVSAVNYLLADRWIFRRALTAATAIALVVMPSAASAAPRPEVLAAWTAYVAQTEAAIDRRPSACAAGWSAPCAEGQSFAVDGGTISHWRGAVFIRAMTVDRLLDRLQHPGTPPPQEDVSAARVLERGSGWLRVYMRIVRHAIVTVSYDTEHLMTFQRVSSLEATAQSVATRIEEVSGGDQGFLWKMNSYWHYEQSSDGVVVSVQTLTLSRDVPVLIKPIAAGIVTRVARESMTRTLIALRRYLSDAVPLG